MCKYANVLVCKCASMQMCWYANVQVCKCASMQICKCVGQFKVWMCVSSLVVWARNLWRSALFYFLFEWRCIICLSLFPSHTLLGNSLTDNVYHIKWFLIVKSFFVICNSSTKISAELCMLQYDTEVTELSFQCTKIQIILYWFHLSLS